MAKRRLLDIQPEELAELQFIVRSGKAEQRLVERAQIILCWQEGKSFVETQQKLGVSEVIINKWRAEWINSKKRITLHFTPTYSSWLNQI